MEPITTKVYHSALIEEFLSEGTVDKSLSEFLLEDGQPEDFNPTTFVINDEGQALWAMRNFAEAERKIQAISSRAKVEHQRISAWESQTTKAPSNTMQFFLDALTSYATRQREAGVKSLSYPDGYVQTRATQAKVVVRDMEGFITWAREIHPDWIRTKQEVDLNVIKAAVSFKDEMVIDQESGEVVDSLGYTPAGVSVTIKVSE